MDAARARADAETAADEDEVEGEPPVVFDQPFDDTPPASVDSPAVREAWLERIRDLVAAGHHDEARASFAEFRRRHPAAPVPADLRGLLAE